jgi:hypothetical protein
MGRTRPHPGSTGSVQPPLEVQRAWRHHRDGRQDPPDSMAQIRTRSRSQSVNHGRPLGRSADALALCARTPRPISRPDHLDNPSERAVRGRSDNPVPGQLPHPGVRATGVEVVVLMPNALSRAAVRRQWAGGDGRPRRSGAALLAKLLGDLVANDQHLLVQRGSRGTAMQGVERPLDNPAAAIGKVRRA